MTNRPDRNEARILSARLGVPFPTVLEWMRLNKLESILDLRKRYPGTEHAETMRRALEDIENWVLGAA